MKTDVSADMHPSQAKKMRAIEEEFGEPFFDIVRGLVGMGYSRRVICGAIGYADRSAFRRACAGVDIRWNSQKDMPIYRQREMNPRWRRAIDAVARNNEKKHLIAGEWLTYREMVTRAGMAKRGGVMLATTEACAARRFLHRR